MKRMMKAVKTAPTEAQPAESDNVKNQSVYNAIKARILDNKLRPGVKLTHQGLAEQLGVSRTPVREALERLSQEEYVTWIPRRGYYVAHIGLVETRELYLMREALELFQVGQLFEQGFHESDLKPLESIEKRYADLITQHMSRERLFIDREFHVTLASLAGNSYLCRQLEGIFDRLILKRRVDGYHDVRSDERHKEHVELLAALKAKDRRRAETVLRAHIAGACERLLNHLRQDEA